MPRDVEVDEQFCRAVLDELRDGETVTVRTTSNPDDVLRALVRLGATDEEVERVEFDGPPREETEEREPSPKKGLMLATHRCSPSFFNGYLQSCEQFSRLRVHLSVVEREPWHRAYAEAIGHFLMTTCETMAFIDPEAVWHPLSVERALQAVEDGRADVVAVSMKTVAADESAAEDKSGDARRRGRVVLTRMQQAVPMNFTLVNRKTLVALCDMHPDLTFPGYRSRYTAYDLFSLMKRGGRLLGEDAAFCQRCSDIGATLSIIEEARAR